MIIASVFLTANRLHPLGSHDNSVIFFIGCHTEISKPCALFTNDNKFTFTNELHAFNPCRKQRCSVTEYVVIIGAVSCVNKIQLISKLHPMLLGIVILKNAAAFYLQSCKSP